MVAQCLEKGETKPGYELFSSNAGLDAFSCLFASALVRVPGPAPCGGEGEHL